MSSNSADPRPFRIQRSVLAVPGTSEDLFSKAARLSSDAVFLDLEDTVTLDQKHDARKKVIAALNDIDWGMRTMAVRINPISTEWAHREIIELVTECPRLDILMLPNVDEPFQVRFVDSLITGLERECRRYKRIGIEAIIETARGLADVESIAACSERLEGICFGAGDYSVAMHTYDTISAPSPEDGDSRSSGRSDPWHYARARIANACHAFGLRPIDGPFTNYRDADGLRHAATGAAALGFEGKWVIHPSQVSICNSVFMPTDTQVKWAEQILESMRHASASGQGVIGLNDGVVDQVHEKLARLILRRNSAVANAHSWQLVIAIL